VWGDPVAGSGGEQWAPPAGDGAATEYGPWDAGAPVAGAGGSRPPRFSRRTKVLAGVTALVTCAGTAWAAGAASGSHTPTVRIEPAVAASAGSAGSTGSTGTGSPGHRFGAHPGGRFGPMFAGRGGAGTIASVDLTDQTFTVTRPTRPPRPAPATSSTSTSTSSSVAPATTTTPATVTVTTSSTTTYSEVESSTFTASDAPVGARIAAFGTRNSDGSLTATSITVIPAGMGPGGKAPAAGSTTPPAPKTPPPNAASRLSKAPFALGQVSATGASPTTSGSPTTLTLTTPWGTETVDTTSATTFTSVVSTDISFTKLAVGQRVVVRGQRQSNGDIAATAVTIIPAGVTPSALGFAGLGFAGRGFVNGPAGGPGAAGPWSRAGGSWPGRRPAGSTTTPSPLA